MSTPTGDHASPAHHGASGGEPQPYPHLELPDLPVLPVPRLEQTRERYLQLLPSLVDDHQLAEAREIADEFFLGDDGIRLQEALLEHADSSPTSWLAEFWDRMYLAERGSNVNVNGFMLFDLPDAEQVGRAAVLVRAAVDFYDTIRRGGPAPETAAGHRLCMTQYGRLFATYRKPRIGEDEVFTSFDSSHIVVAAAGQFHRLPVYRPDGTAADITQISAGLYHALRSSKERENEPAIGMLTTDGRDDWARARTLLEEASPPNRDSLAAIDTAMFVLCLDDISSADVDAGSRLMMHGDGHNRWFDKLQLIVAANGFCGINLEHAPVDGHTVWSLAQEIYWAAEAHSRSPTQNPGGGNEAPGPCVPQPLVFQVPSAVAEALATATDRFDALVTSIDMSVLEFQDFGAGALRALDASPDAFVQMAVQLAYRRLTGVTASTYESVMLKRYYHGRTGCVRTVSDESMRFIALFGNDATDQPTKASALRTAMTRHQERVRECQSGLDVDRHTFGLLNMARLECERSPGRELPELFRHWSYSLITRSVVSTSNASDKKGIPIDGFSPVVPEGVGLGYSIDVDRIAVCVTSFEGKAVELRNHVASALLEMRELLATQPA